MTFAEQEFRERRRANPLKAPAAPVREAEPAPPGDLRALTAAEMDDAAGHFRGFKPEKMRFVADRLQIRSHDGRVLLDSGEAPRAPVESDPSGLPLSASGADADSGKHYRYSYRQIKLDPYRIIAVYGITHPAHQHALKKLLRAGKSVKSLRQDIREVQDALTRWLEMLDEDDAHGD